MANNYTTAAKVFEALPDGNYTTPMYTIVTDLIATASRMFDFEVGREPGFFYPTTDEVTRYYNGSGYAEQEIDEFVSITSVSVAEEGGTSSTDYTAWAATDYIVFPYNYSSQGKPITKLIIDTNGTKAAWYAYLKSVKIVGIAGYATSTPSPIETACRIQVARWFMRAKGGWQDVSGNDEFGRLRFKGMTELDGDIKLLLHPYKLELDR